MSNTAVALAPLIGALKPIVKAVLATLASGAVTIGVALLSRWTGVTIQSAYVETLRQAAQTEAGVLVAEASDNLASKSIPVSSPLVAAAAAHIEASLPDAMAAVGMTSDGLARLVAGEIGKLQAQVTATATAAAPPSSPR